MQKKGRLPGKASTWCFPSLAGDSEFSGNIIRLSQLMMQIDNPIAVPIISSKKARIEIMNLKSVELTDLAEHIRTNFSPAERAKLARLIEPTPSTGRMTSDEFENMMNMLDATSTRRKYSDRSREAARLVFVMGAKSPEAASQTGLKVQGVDQLIKRIERRIANVPDGWTSITAWLPSGVAKQVQTLAEQLITAHDSGKTLGESYSFSLVQE
jgi:hypothetical protein